MKDYVIHNEWEILEEKSCKNSGGDIMSKLRCKKCGNIIYRPRHIFKNPHSFTCSGCQKVYLESVIGKTFGKLTVISYSGFIKGRHKFLCQCECGSRSKDVRLKDLLNGNAKSCGCAFAENSRLASITHGLSNHPLYATYIGIRNRCYNINNGDYPDYGGRGIKLSDEWLGENGFINFYNWSIQNGYESHIKVYGRSNTSIDRADVNGDYSPYNCRWATNLQQANNTRTNHIVQYEGIDYTLAQFCRTYGLDYKYTWLRITSKNIPLSDIVGDRKKNVIRFV